MGIRVNKMVGYGLTDIQTEGYALTDPRINPDGIVCQYEKYDDLSDWMAHLEKTFVDGELRSDQRFRVISSRLEHQLIQIKLEKEQVPKWHLSPRDAVVWRSGDGGLPNVLCVRPVAWIGWHRHDDTLDWMEETYLPAHGAQTDWVELLPDGPFPHNRFFMDARDGRRLDSDHARHWLLFQEHLDGDDPEVRESILDRTAQELGFTDVEECTAHFAPYVPEEIQLLLEWGEAFTDPTVMWQLRPMLYTFWA